MKLTHLVMCLWFYSGACNNLFHGHEDRSDWVDPSDMLNFDLSSGQIKNEKKYAGEDKTIEENKKEKPAVPTKCDESLERDLNICRREKQNIEKSYQKVEEQLENRPVCDVKYFKQYVKSMVEKLSSAGPEVTMQDTVAYVLTVQLSKEDLNVLRNFGHSSDGSIQDAHQIMANMLKEVHLHLEYQPETWSTFTYDFLKTHLNMILQLCAVFAVCSVGIWIQVTLKLSWFSLSYKLIILLFMMSVPWNWWHLYKTELASRQAEAMKNMPVECTPEQEQTVWQLLASSLTIRTDRCAKYHERMMIDPMWEVAPTRAVAVTITKFFFEPLEYIGRALGKFIRAPLEELPMYMWPYALAFTTIVFLLVVIMLFGYKIRLLWFFGLEPDSEKRKDNQMITLTAQVKELSKSIELSRAEEKQEITHMQQTLKAITGSDRPETMGPLATFNPVDSIEGFGERNIFLHPTMSEPSLARQQQRIRTTSQDTPQLHNTPHFTSPDCENCKQNIGTRSVTDCGEGGQEIKLHQETRISKGATKAEMNANPREVESSDNKETGYEAAAKLHVEDINSNNGGDHSIGRDCDKPLNTVNDSESEELEEFKLNGTGVEDLQSSSN